MCQANISSFDPSSHSWKVGTIDMAISQMKTLRYCGISYLPKVTQLVNFLF